MILKTVSVFHKMTLNFLYNPYILSSRKIFNVLHFVDIILIFSELSEQYDSEFNYNFWSIFGTLKNLPKIAQFLRCIFSLCFCNTWMIFTLVWLFFHSKQNEYDIDRIKNYHFIILFKKWPSLLTHLLKNWDGFENDFFPKMNYIIDD